MTLFSRNFRSKTGKYSKANKKGSFKVKRKQKTPNDVKWNALWNAYVRHLIVINFDPQTQNFDFEKYMPFQSKIWHLSEKKYAIKLYSDSTDAKF